MIPDWRKEEIVGFDTVDKVDHLCSLFPVDTTEKRDCRGQFKWRVRQVLNPSFSGFDPCNYEDLAFFLIDYGGYEKHFINKAWTQRKFSRNQAEIIFVLDEIKKDMLDVISRRMSEECQCKQGESASYRKFKERYDQ